MTDTVKVRVEKHLEPGEAVPRYVVKDAEGNAVPTHMANDYIQQSDRRRATWSADVYFTGKDIPSLGYKTYYLEPGEANVASPLTVGLGLSRKRLRQAQRPQQRHVRPVPQADPHHLSQPEPARRHRGLRRRVQLRLGLQLADDHFRGSRAAR